MRRKIAANTLDGFEVPKGGVVSSPIVEASASGNTEALRPIEGIVCPICGGESRVSNTLRIEGGIVRYRICRLCRYHFSTKELC